MQTTPDLVTLRFASWAKAACGAAAPASPNRQPCCRRHTAWPPGRATSRPGPGDDRRVRRDVRAAQRPPCRGVHAAHERRDDRRRTRLRHRMDAGRGDGCALTAGLRAAALVDVGHSGHANSMEVAMATTIKVNGVDRTVDVDGDTPLLWVLRDVLGMTGTKFGCGMALCGACTVHVDGVAIRSCITPIDSIGSVRDHDDRGDRRDSGGRQDPEGLARPRGRAMRVLPVGPDHVRFGAACEQPASDRFRYRRRDVRQHLPLRDLCPHSRSDQAGARKRTGRRP